ncbi:hypothetical protein FBF28_03985 [Candidatus Saccharibacteria bacterium oral taxon 488]|nr:hypothetical protein FBF28_03985 [Candidatus Saccharibacteria bacterium oral taxon 488]
MSELSQTGERDRELTAEEWKMVDKLVDEMGWPYYKARLALGLEPPADQIVHANSQPLPDQNISVNKKTPPCERSRFDTRTQQAHEASGQGPLTEEQKQTNRDGIRMVRTALRNARAA